MKSNKVEIVQTLAIIMQAELHQYTSIGNPFHPFNFKLVLQLGQLPRPPHPNCLSLIYTSIFLLMNLIKRECYLNNSLLSFKIASQIIHPDDMIQ